MSFYAGMAEDEQYIFTMQLIKTIAKNLSPHFREYKNATPLSETLGVMEEDGSMVYNDPVVSKFLRHIQCHTDNIVDFRQRMSVIARINLGKHWSEYSSPGHDGITIVQTIKERGVEGLSAFVLSACKLPLSEIIEQAKKVRVNYLPSNKAESLFTVIVRTNSLIPLGSNFVDSSIMDVLVSFSAEAVSKNLSSVMKMALEVRRPYESSEYILESVILTEVIIRSNEDILCYIPLTHDGQIPGKEYGTYSLKYRRNLNAKGASAYLLDFDQMQLVAGETQVLVDLSKHFPRRAARKLRGVALDDALGL